VRLNTFLLEWSQKKGKGLTMIDIDETIFKTFAKIKVIKNGSVIRELDNQEFNTYDRQDDEEFDFGEFRNAELFNKTSKPIKKTIERILSMIKKIGDKGSKIVFLTARTNFDDKNTFLDTFRKYGIPIDDIYVERAGNYIKTTTDKIAPIKKSIIMKYIQSGEYRRVRLIDDDIKNCKTFLELKNDITDELKEKVRRIHGLDDTEEEPIKFFALQVTDDGTLKEIN